MGRGLARYFVLSYFLRRRILFVDPGNVPVDGPNFS